MLKRDPLAEVIDCTEMVNSISTLDDVELALQYLAKRFDHFEKSKVDPKCVLVFDNINGLCGSLDGD